MPKKIRIKGTSDHKATKRPTVREWLERTRQMKPIQTKRSAAELIRELRDAH